MKAWFKAVKAIEANTSPRPQGSTTCQASTSTLPEIHTCLGGSSNCSFKKITSTEEFSTWLRDSYPFNHPFWGTQRRYKMVPGFEKGSRILSTSCVFVLTAQSLMNGVAIRSLLGRRSPETGTASRAQRMRLEAEQTSRQRVVPGVVRFARKIGNLPEGPRHAEKAKVTCVDHNLLGMTKPTHNPGCELLEQGSLSLYYIYIFRERRPTGVLPADVRKSNFENTFRLVWNR